MYEAWRKKDAVGYLTKLIHTKRKKSVGHFVGGWGWGLVPVMLLGGRLTLGCAREVEIRKTKSPKTLLHADGLKS